MNSRQERKAESTDAVIVGGGQAGISLSYFLQKNQVEHIVLEKERGFSAWTTLWDSFQMNTANWMNALPGANHDFAPGANRNGLGSKADALRYFQAYLESVSPPIKEHTTVTKVQQGNNGLWRVETPQIIYETRNVVICTGGAPHPIIPAITADIPPSVRQLHSSEYRNPEQLMKGNILVVGSGSSGVQICEDLAKSNRFDRLYLAVSGNFSFPWKVMGIPIHTILRYSGFANINRTSWLGKRMYESMKGKGDPATPPSPAALNSNYGVELVGRVVAVDEEKIRCSDEQAVTTENLTIVWCTGFNADYDYIEVESRKRVFDNEEDPIHERGVASGAPGLYFIGLRFQYTPVSQDIFGVGQDSQHVADHLSRRLFFPFGIR